jgi:CubicO group peptidase (beta-lactamase class C family)
MRRATARLLPLAVRVALAAGLAVFCTAGELTAQAQAAREDFSALIARVEAPRTPGGEGLAGLTLAQVMAAAKVPGASVAVVKDFQIQWAKGYGVADAASGRPVDVDTRFQAASISKPLTAMAALRLAQDGRLSMDLDVNRILESWKVPASEHNRLQPVTPRSLFSHTSGADDGFGFPGYDPSLPRPTLVQILNGEKPSNVGVVTFARAPYEAYKYSGGGVTLMQLALTDLTDEPFAAMMQRLVLGPLGMTHSSYEQPMPAAVEPSAAHMHDNNGAAMSAPWHVYPEQAAAGLWTTASDLARFVIEVQKAVRGPQGAVLSQASAREMVTPVGVGPYAVGLSIQKRGEGWYFEHTGSNRGFRALVVGHVRKGYGLVVMTNGNNGSQVMNEILERVSAVYRWDVLDKPLPR